MDMKRFLLVVMAALALVSMSCTQPENDNSGSGGTTPEEEEHDYSGWYKYKISANRVSATYYLKYDKDGEVLRCGDSANEWTETANTTQWTSIKDTLSYTDISAMEDSSYTEFTKVSDETTLPIWCQGHTEKTDIVLDSVSDLIGYSEYYYYFTVPASYLLSSNDYLYLGFFYRDTDENGGYSILMCDKNSTGYYEYGIKISGNVLTLSDGKTCALSMRNIYDASGALYQSYLTVSNVENFLNGYSGSLVFRSAYHRE